jgi:RecA/RadA recombinase
MAKKDKVAGSADVEVKMSAKEKLDQIKKDVNKKMGVNVAFTSDDENPSEVKDWISTGSRLLDGIISQGRMAGIPVGKITELAGLESCLSPETIIEVIVLDKEEGEISP